jgi:hypothetical protein
MYGFAFAKLTRAIAIAPPAKREQAVMLDYAMKLRSPLESALRRNPE